MLEVEVLRARFAGAVVAPGDPSYDEVRRVHNGLVDKHPALIVRCAGAEDVVAAVRLGREAGLEISVRGGGHNVAGKAVTDGGVMIDLALLKQIEVDPGRRTITAGGGVTWGELNEAAHDGQPLLNETARDWANGVLTLLDDVRRHPNRPA